MRGDIIAVKNMGWLYKKIRESIGCDYDHVAICVSDRLIVEATPFGGVKIVPFAKYLSSTMQVFSLHEDCDKEKFIEFALMQVGRGYDFLNFIALWWKAVFGTNFEKLDIKEAFLCVELLADSASYAGFSFNENVQKDWQTPCDIINSNKVEARCIL